MSTGFSDAGWTLTLGSINQDGIETITTGANANHIVPSTDIINYMKFCGVYVFNGAEGSVNNKSYEIFCSLPYTIKLLPDGTTGLNVIQGILLYPGFGFIGYNGNNYGGQYTYYYCNVEKTPKLLSFYRNGALIFPSATGIQYDSTNANLGGGGFPEQNMRSIKVFLLDSEITIKGLSYF